MAIGAASGTPQYSGNFVPEVWSSNLLVKFYDATVAAAVSNTDYEGEIKDVGDKVIIRQIPDIVITDYVKGQTLVHQRPEKAVVEFPIERAKYFDFICDDIDKHQTDIRLMESWSDDASQWMKIKIDTDFLADVYADAATENQGASAGRKSGNIDLGSSGAPKAVTKSDILDLYVDCGVVLTENNAPETGRCFVAPAWFIGMVGKSDIKDASLAGDATSVARNGRIGIIWQFETFSSNLVYSETDGIWTAYHALALQKKAISFVSQLTKVEHLDKVESTFGSIVRGLNVFDWKGLKGEALCDVYMRNGT